MSTDQPDAGHPSTEASPLRLLWVVSGWKITRKEMMEHILSTDCIDQSLLFLSDFHSSLLVDCPLFSFNNKKEMLWEKSIISFLINLPKSFSFLLQLITIQFTSSLVPLSICLAGNTFSSVWARRMWFLLWCISREIINGPIQKIQTVNNYW